jgi:hypothetical protein
MHDASESHRVSIDAAFANRTNMKSTSGMCVTLGLRKFITSSKTQKLNSKSSTEAEIIAVSDGMNIPLWLADFIAHQGYKNNLCDWNKAINLASHCLTRDVPPLRRPGLSRCKCSGYLTILGSEQSMLYVCLRRT